MFDGITAPDVTDLMLSINEDLLSYQDNSRTATMELAEFGIFETVVNYEDYILVLKLTPQYYHIYIYIYIYILLPRCQTTFWTVEGF